jgi:hypothetical protein
MSKKVVPRAPTSPALPYLIRNWPEAGCGRGGLQSLAAYRAPLLLQLPTILAAAGDTDVKDKLAKGYKAGDLTYKVHLDGDNLVPYLTGQVPKSPRDSCFDFCSESFRRALQPARQHRRRSPDVPRQVYRGAV